MGKYRTVIAFQDYFDRFLDEQPQKVQAKILQILRVVEEIATIPETYLKHIEGTNGLYEIRVSFGRNRLRIFCCFDEEKLVVLLSGFHKKTQKTPQKEIKKAVQYMNDYFDSKTQTNEN